MRRERNRQTQSSSAFLREKTNFISCRQTEREILIWLRARNVCRPAAFNSDLPRSLDTATVLFYDSTFASVAIHASRVILTGSRPPDTLLLTRSLSAMFIHARIRLRYTRIDVVSSLAMKCREVERTQIPFFFLRVQYHCSVHI